MTDKVYDFCFATLTQTNVCFPVPAACLPLPIPVTPSGTVTGVTCSVVGSTPIGGGFANVTVLIIVTVTITLTNAVGVVVCTYTDTLTFMQTFTLCSPTGTHVTCEIPSSSMTPMVVVDNSVCGNVSICLLVESLATVKLLVPTYGYCTPAPCSVSPVPPLTCPPSPLYPPQCVIPM